MGGIKNKHIIHFLEEDGHYACMKACGVTPGKFVKIWNLVTCTNCLKHIPSRQDFVTNVDPFEGVPFIHV